MYEIDSDTRVIELVSIAGGFTELVDMLYVHKHMPLARRVIDEEKIYIPSTAEGDSGGSDPVIAARVGGSKVNLNTASREVLVSLPGIGEVTAGKIIDARPIGSVDELLEVSGIGDKLVSDIQDKVVF